MKNSIGVSIKYPNLCLILEFFSYGDLSGVLKKHEKEFTIPMIIKTAMDIVSGMIYFHERNIVRRGFFYFFYLFLIFYFYFLNQ